MPAENLPAGLFPPEAFEEAIRLTAGLPYRNLGNVRIEKEAVREEKPAPESELKKEQEAVSGDDYQVVFDAYTDNEGKFSYELLNKDLIRFSRRSSIARQMIRDYQSVEKIRLYLCTAKFRTITHNEKLTSREAKTIASLLDDLSPRGIFRELNAELRRQLKEAKE
ncbi:MAG: hypothetical protein IJL98_07420 [Lachnospiraceae bacterium]|nr:hypothetical protein [Lachnospiraceae bacterium]